MAKGKVFTIQDAKNKFAECPEFKEFVWRWLLDQVAHKRQVQVQEAMHAARRLHFASRVNGERYTVNNNLSPAIARLFLSEHPEAKPYVHLRKAACGNIEE